MTVTGRVSDVSNIFIAWSNDNNREYEGDILYKLLPSDSGDNITLKTFLNDNVTDYTDIENIAYSVVNLNKDIDISSIISISGDFKMASIIDLSVNQYLDVSDDATFKSDIFISGNTYSKGNLDISKNINIQGRLDVSENIFTQSNVEVSGNILTYGNVEISGNVDVSKNITTRGNVDISGNILTYGNVEISGNMDVSKNITTRGNVDISGNILTYGNVEISGNMDVSKNITTRGNVDISGNILTYGNVEISGNMDVSKNITTRGNVEISGNVDISSNLTTQGNTLTYGNADISGNVTTQGNTLTYGNADISGNVDISCNLTTQGNADIIGNILTYGNVEISGNMDVSKNITTRGNVDISGNLTTLGNAEISGNVDISGNLTTQGNVEISGNADISGNLTTQGNTLTYGNADISGNVTIQCNTLTYGNAEISGNMTTKGNTLTYGNADISGNVDISGNITTQGNADIIGNILTYGNVEISGNMDVSKNITTRGNVEISGNLTTLGNAEISGNMTTQGNTLTYGNAEISGNVDISGNLTTQGNVDIIGNLTTQGNAEISGNVDISGNLTTQGNTEIIGNLTTQGNADIISNVNIKKNVDVSGNVDVYGYLNTKNKLYVSDDIEAYSNLNTQGNIDVKGKVDVLGNIYTTSNLDVSKNIIVDGYVEISGNIYTKSNVEISGNIITYGNMNTTGNMDISGNITSRGNVDTSGNVDVYGYLKTKNKLYVTNDIQANRNVNVVNNIDASGNIDVFGYLNTKNKLYVKGDIEANSNLKIKQNIDASGNLAVYGAINTKNNLGVKGNVDISGNLKTHKDLDVLGNVEIYGDLNPYKNVSISGNVEISGNVTTQKDLYVLSNIKTNQHLDVSGNVEISGNLTTHKNVYVLSNIKIDQNVDVSENVDVSGNIKIHKELDVLGNITTYDTLYVSNNAEISGNVYTKKNVEVSGNIDVSGNIKTYKNLQVVGNTDVYGNINNYGNQIIKGNNITDGNTTIKGDLNVLNGVNLNRLDVNGDISTNGTFDLSGTLKLNGFVVGSGDNGLSFDVIDSTVINTSGNLNINGDIISLGNINTQGDLTIGNVSTNGDLDVSGNITTSGNLDVSKNVYIQQNITISGESSLKKTKVTDLSAEGVVDISGFLFVNGVKIENLGTYSDKILIKGDFDICGETKIFNTLDVSGKIHTSSNLDISGSVFIENNLEVLGTSKFKNLYNNNVNMYENYSINDLSICYLTTDTSSQNYLWTKDKLNNDVNLLENSIVSVNKYTSFVEDIKYSFLEPIRSFSTNDTGNIIIIGQPSINNNKGITTIKELINNNWVIKRIIHGENVNQQLGYSVSMNENSNKYIIASYNKGVNIYDNDTSYFFTTNPRIVKINAQGTLAVSCNQSSQITKYSYINNTWIQSTTFNTSINGGIMGYNDDIMIINNTKLFCSNVTLNTVYVYNLSNNSLIQTIQRNISSFFGSSLSTDENAQRLIITAYGDVTQSLSGEVLIYDLSNASYIYKDAISNTSVSEIGKRGTTLNAYGNVLSISNNSGSSASIYKNVLNKWEYIETLDTITTVIKKDENIVCLDEDINIEVIEVNDIYNSTQYKNYTFSKIAEKPLLNRVYPKMLLISKNTLPLPLYNEFDTIVLRRTTGLTGYSDYFIHINEIQLWVNNINVLPQVGSTLKTKFVNWLTKAIVTQYSTAYAYNAFNELFTTPLDTVGNNNVNTALVVYMSQTYQIKDIQSLILYNNQNGINDPKRTIGLAFELYNSIIDPTFQNNLLYTSPITTVYHSYRYNFPSFSTYSRLYATSGNSTSQIINRTDTQIFNITLPTYKTVTDYYIYNRNVNNEYNILYSDVENETDRLYNKQTSTKIRPKYFLIAKNLETTIQSNVKTRILQYTLYQRTSYNIYNYKILYQDRSLQKYGLYEGNYIFNNIPETKPIAIINTTDTKYLNLNYSGEDPINKTIWFNSGNFYQTPQLIYDTNVDTSLNVSFYSGSINVTVNGDFKESSIITYNTETNSVMDFCGNSILIYTETCDVNFEISEEYYEDNYTYNIPPRYMFNKEGDILYGLSKYGSSILIRRFETHNKVVQKNVGLKLYDFTNNHVLLSEIQSVLIVNNSSSNTIKLHQEDFDISYTYVVNDTYKTIKRLDFENIGSYKKGFIKHDSSLNDYIPSSNIENIIQITIIEPDNKCVLNTSKGKIGVSHFADSVTIDTNLTTRGNILCSGSIMTSSDDRLKYNRENILGIETLRKLNPQKYAKLNEPLHENETYKDKTHMIQAGFIAQDLLKTDLHFAVNVPVSNENFIPYTLDYNSIFAYSIQAIKDLDNELLNEKNKVLKLEQQLLQEKHKVQNLENNFNTLIADISLIKSSINIVK